jgi:hypothetical protein
MPASQPEMKMSTITEKGRRLVAGSGQTGGPVPAVWNGTVIAESDGPLPERLLPLHGVRE